MVISTLWAPDRETRQAPCSPQAAFPPRAALILASFIFGLISRAAPPRSLLGGSQHSHFIDGETEAPRGKWFGAAACESTMEPEPELGPGFPAGPVPRGGSLSPCPWHPWHHRHPESLFSSALYPTTPYPLPSGGQQDRVGRGLRSLEKGEKRVGSSQNMGAQVCFIFKAG